LILYDSKIFGGLISFETFKGDYQTKLDGNYIKKFKLFKPLEIKNILIKYIVEIRSHIVFQIIEASYYGNLIFN